jgi:type IV secretory pathway TrbL component
MKKIANYLPSLLMIFLGLLLIGFLSLCFSVFKEAILNILPNKETIVIYVIVLNIIAFLFIGIGIYILIKEKQNNQKLDSLDAIGIRGLGEVKNLTHHQKRYDLIQFDVEVVISKKGTKHRFTSPLISYSKFRIKEGDYLYVIYDKNNLNNYAVVYDKIIHKKQSN